MCAVLQFLVLTSGHPDIKGPPGQNSKARIDEPFCMERGNGRMTSDGGATESEILRVKNIHGRCQHDGFCTLTDTSWHSQKKPKTFHCCAFWIHLTSHWTANSGCLNICCFYPSSLQINYSIFWPFSRQCFGCVNLWFEFPIRFSDCQSLWHIHVIT